MTRLRKLSRRSLVLIGIAPVPLVGVLIFSSTGWLRTLPDAVALTITSSAALIVMAWSLAVSIAIQRRQDEVEIASSRYAMQHGFTIGTIGVGTLLLIPPFRTCVLETSTSLSLALKGGTDQAPLLAYVGGFMTLIVAQIVGAAVMSSIWWRGKQ